jgi:hypothetical protein
VSSSFPLPKQRNGTANTSVLLPSRGLAGRAGSFLRDSAPLTWGTPYDILSPDSRTSVGPGYVWWDTARVGPGPRGCKERKARLHSGEPSAPYCPGIPRAGGEWPKPLPPLRMENAIARSSLLVILWPTRSSMHVFCPKWKQPRSARQTHKRTALSIGMSCGCTTHCRQNRLTREAQPSRATNP